MTTIVEIPTLVAGSHFPDREKITFLTPLPVRDYPESNVKVYQGSEYSKVTVEFPTGLFDYDPKKRIFKHLPEPYFEIHCSSYLEWFLDSKDEPADDETILGRFNSFLEYSQTRNLVTHGIRFCTALKYRGYHDWGKYPHPAEFMTCYGNENPHTLHPMPVGCLWDGNKCELRYPDGRFFIGFRIEIEKRKRQYKLSWDLFF